ncbi:hypothetical protein ABZ611_20280 [Streptomyces sp. NPDC007861]
MVTGSALTGAGLFRQMVLSGFGMGFTFVTLTPAAVSGDARC